ncbi:PREDICTED: TMV resistance protein N-like isoform X2 [Prunus mume]|uniref:TMV resistance protein N-like isoform X2 n=1 Tax=Prunus mume TaxID=102107 RepID=A0ABM0NC87_PRUMU|nr:PREDICTED: TMV resistance protein N-like isoform X2 [Prunus mume]
MESIEFFQVFIIIIILIMTLFYIYFRSLTSSSSSASSVDTDIPPLREKYDLFISFRGEDTRDAFASHLHKALLGKKIETYMDYRLEKGDDIGPALLEAIGKSKIALVIFSKDYASSTWCMKELVHILGCKKSHGQIVIPIFYPIDPSDVRKQKGTYAIGGWLWRLKKRFKVSMDEVANWRAALEEAANISGFHDSSKTGTEADFVEEIVQDVLTKLNRESSSDLKGLVGIQRKIEEIESLLCLDSPGVLSVGIWGMGGIGKTTLADAVFHKLSSKFDAACFLANVREKSEQTGGLNELRNELLREILKDRDTNIGTSSIGRTFIRDRLSRTKAFIVIDDVNDPRQLEFLVGYHDQFCDGSRIIITARDKGVLEQKVDTDKIYKVKGLRLDEALQLFHLHAFRNIESPTTDYTELSREVVEYIKGIPLALKVLGSSFHRYKSKREWEDEMNKLKRSPNPKILGVLRISYDGLEENEKEIFLDIACFHKDRNMNNVNGMLDIRGFSWSSGIKVLIDMSLISISERNSIEMHDLLQEMGRAIVREQCIEQRSRLFSAEDVYDVLTNNKEAARVQAIFFEELKLNHADYRKIYKLRLLIAETYDFGRGIFEIFSLDLPNSLSYLDWVGYPLKSLPSKFSPENLLVLHMPFSEVGAQLWNEGQCPVNLKEIDLGYCEHLSEVPNLSRSLKIERIDLVGCKRLIEIPTYFQHLHKLTYLRLAGCQNLKSLPAMPCNVEFNDFSHTALGSEVRTHAMLLPAIFTRPYLRRKLRPTWVTD